MVVFGLTFTVPDVAPLTANPSVVEQLSRLLLDHVSVVGAHHLTILDAHRLSLTLGLADHGHCDDDMRVLAITHFGLPSFVNPTIASVLEHLPISPLMFHK